MKNEKAEVRYERAREKGKRDAAGNHSYICGLCIQGFAVSGRMSAFGDEPDGQIGGDLLYLDAEQLYPGADSAVSGAALCAGRGEQYP